MSRGLVRPRNVVVAASLAALLGGCGRWGYEESPLCVTGELCAPAEPDGRDPDADPFAPDAGPSAGGPDAAIDQPGCGSLQLLHETFTGNAVNGGWGALWRGAASAGLSNDRVTLTLGAGSGDAESRYIASYASDLRDSEIAVEVLRTGGRTTALELRDGQGIDRFITSSGPRAASRSPSRPAC